MKKSKLVAVETSFEELERVVCEAEAKGARFIQLVVPPPKETRLNKEQTREVRKLLASHQTC